MGQLKGYKQTPEHIAKRIKHGSDHPNWQGDNIVEASGRSRALRMYPPAPCRICGAPSERHHIDGNTANNDPSNIDRLCHFHQMEVDGRLANWAQQARERIAQTTAAAAAEKRARTHCKRGHEYNLTNTYINPAGARVCRPCRKFQKGSAA